jgi:four helix bundle protein
MKKYPQFDLQGRSEDFGVLVIRIVDDMSHSRAGRLLSDQLLRSGTSPALHYGEAQAAESKRDFIHKMKVALKELRESQACLNMIFRAAMHPKPANVEACRKECSELVAIFQASVKTAEGNSRT